MSDDEALADATLFVGYEPDAAFAVDASLSAGRRLTLRQRFDVARGIHPLTGEPTRPDLGTCGDCIHRLQFGAHGYPKCHRPSPPIVARTLLSHSAVSDCRAWWPACPSFQPKETEDG